MTELPFHVIDVIVKSWLLIACGLEELGKVHMVNGSTGCGWQRFVCLFFIYLFSALFGVIFCMIFGVCSYGIKIWLGRKPTGHPSDKDKIFYQLEPFNRMCVVQSLRSWSMFLLPELFIGFFPFPQGNLITTIYQYFLK
jgi:hypothetical protein